MQSTSNPSVDSIKASADTALDRAVESAHSMVDSVAEKAGPAVERVRGSINSATEALQTGVEDLGEFQKRMIDSCRGCVRDHPLASIGLAILAGLAISHLTKR